MSIYFNTEIFEFHLSESIDLQSIFTEIENYSIISTNSYSLIGKTAKHSPMNLTSLNFKWSIDLKQILINLSNLYFQNNFKANLPESFILNTWKIDLSKGDISMIHNHPGAEISGVLYISIPDNLINNEGCIQFIDPRPAARFSKLFHCKNIIFHPKKFHGLIFPAWLEHTVLPHFSDQNRISLAWNISL